MAEMSDYNIQELVRKNETVYIKSDFKFIKAHNGFRPGYTHVLLGMTSTGKTTLVRSILKDMYRAGRIFVWLSEESNESFAGSLATINRLENVNNIIFESEVTRQKIPIQQLKHELELELINSKAKIFLFDNITTSRLHLGQRFEEQSKNIMWLKELCIRLKIPFVILAHTKSGLDKSRLLEPDDILGDKTLSNLAEYFYTIQRIVVRDKIFTLLHVNKSRYHDGAGKIYKLVYDQAGRYYSCDVEYDFEQFKKIYADRNKL